MKVVKIITSLIGPVVSLLRALDDGKIDKLEREQLIVEFGLAVAKIVEEIVTPGLPEEEEVTEEVVTQ